MEAKEKISAAEAGSGTHRHAERPAGQRNEAAPSAPETGEPARLRLVEGLRAGNAVESEIVGLVRNAVSETVRATGSVATEAIDVARNVAAGALQAGVEVGTGVTLGARSIAKGVVMGAQDVGGDVGNVLMRSANGVFTAAGGIGLGVVNVATAVLVGTVGGIKEVLGAALPRSRDHIRGEARAA